MKNKIFKNRKDAFHQLCERLPLKEMKNEKWVVLAISSGAVPIAIDLSEKLKGDFDYLFTQKIFIIALILEDLDV